MCQHRVIHSAPSAFGLAGRAHAILEAVETGLPIAVDAGHDTLLALAVTLNGSPANLTGYTPALYVQPAAVGGSAQ